MPHDSIVGFVRRVRDSSRSDQKESEICQEILFGQAVSEIPPQPPFDKGGQGGFGWAMILGKILAAGAALPMHK